jgi:Domain of unknown function (DUF5666)
MYRFVLTLACAFALAAAPGVAQAAKAPAAKGAQAAKAEPTKTAAGTITSISGSSVTVKTASGDMTFSIDQKTRVIEPGAGTKARAAQAEGKSGVPVTDVLKTGQAVEVKYHETGMHAASIRTMASVPSGAKGAKAGAAASGGEGAPAGAGAAATGGSAKAQTARGTVSAVSDSSLTVKGAKGDMTFTVDGKTTVSGTGMGTLGRKLNAEGEKSTLTKFVKEGDSVTVTYHDMAGAMHASLIRITRKKV